MNISIYYFISKIFVLIADIIKRNTQNMCTNTAENFMISIIFNDLNCLGSNINHDYSYTLLYFKNNLGRTFSSLSAMIYLKVSHYRKTIQR